MKIDIQHVAGVPDSWTNEQIINDYLFFVQDHNTQAQYLFYCILLDRLETEEKVEALIEEVIIHKKLRT